MRFGVTRIVCTCHFHARFKGARCAFSQSVHCSSLLFVAQSKHWTRRAGSRALTMSNCVVLYSSLSLSVCCCLLSPLLSLLCALSQSPSLNFSRLFNNPLPSLSQFGDSAFDTRNRLDDSMETLLQLALETIKIVAKTLAKATQEFKVCGQLCGRRNGSFCQCLPIVQSIGSLQSLLFRLLPLCILRFQWCTLLSRTFLPRHRKSCPIACCWRTKILRRRLRFRATTRPTRSH